MTFSNTKIMQKVNVNLKEEISVINDRNRSLHPQVFTHRSKFLLQSPPTAVNRNIKEIITLAEAHHTETHPTKVQHFYGI